VTPPKADEARVLLVEDDEIPRDLHNAVLLGAGFDTATAGTLAELRDQVGRSRFDVVLLDLRLPDGNALEIIPEIRQNTSAGIIVATSSRDEHDRLAGLEGGADDFLIKPVHPRELLARIRNLLTRLRATAALATTDTLHRFEGWTADMVARKISFQDGRDVHLTESEFRLLEALIKGEGKPIHRDRLVALISDDEEVTTRAVDKVVYRTRIKLHTYLGNAAPLIETVHGYGYRFIAKRV
jgi:DNA-binding response OmpR family regulator